MANENDAGEAGVDEIDETFLELVSEMVSLSSRYGHEATRQYANLCGDVDDLPQLCRKRFCDAKPIERLAVHAATGGILQSNARGLVRWQETLKIGPVGGDSARKGSFKTFTCGALFAAMVRGTFRAGPQIQGEGFGPGYRSAAIVYAVMEELFACDVAWQTIEQVHVLHFVGVINDVLRLDGVDVEGVRKALSGFLRTDDWQAPAVENWEWIRAAVFSSAVRACVSVEHYNVANVDRDDFTDTQFEVPEQPDSLSN